ncbi:MAG: serine/threonine-protein kinase, partial [Gimesia chilikensis]
SHHPRERICAARQLREQVAALLNETEQSGEFLGVPVLEQMRRSSEATRVAGEDTGAQPGLDDLDLGFLQPATEAGSLGVLGHYDIQELIGRGGCGIVFKAFDQRLHRIVAIKVMTPAMAATSPARKRFLREARATAAIRHENVVNIYAVEEAPLPFLVMEYIDGKTLQQMIDDNGPLDLTTIVKYGRMIADGLEAAHLQGLIHRDIKPGNILIESGTGRVKITDFGLARAADDASRSQSGIIAGTPMYMSPEQVQGLKLDRKSDLFSLGSVLYVMCSGRPPFRAPSTL